VPEAPILVTGVPRSGTSWVGQMLDAGGQVVYINEPLNDRHPPGRSPGVLAVAVTNRFPYISEANEETYLRPFQETLRLRYHHLAELRQNRSPRDLARMAKYSSSFARGRLRGRRPLLDDPFALFSAGWFARRLGCEVVAVVRHPAAMAASRKRLGWRTDFRHLLRQPLLLEEWLHPFEAAMRDLVHKPDPLAEGSLLWRMGYHVVAQLREREPAIRLIRNEDLSSDPGGRYAELYASLGLPLTDQAAATIEHSSSGPAANGNGHSWSLSRQGFSKTGFRPLDSRANAVAWKKELTPEEVARVHKLTEDVAQLYYSDSDWR
jgi:sulfotransferase family protein